MGDAADLCHLNAGQNEQTVAWVQPGRRNRDDPVMRLRAALEILCIGLAVLAANTLPASCATRHVVMLFDERLELPGLAALEAEFVGTLTSNSADRIETYREPMDLSRFESSTNRTLLRDYLRAKYANKKIDVAVAFIKPALDFLLDNGDTIFPGTPIVFCGVDGKELRGRALPAHVRGILVKREFAPTLAIALRLHPEAKRVVVVAGSSEFDKRLLDQARGEFRPYEDRLAFTYLTGLPLQKVLSELAQLPPQTIVLFTTFFQDGPGEAFISHDVVERVSAAASAPVYGFIDQYLGRGIVGGSLYSFSAQGAEAARLVSRLLTGTEPAGPSMVETQTSKVMFDWRQIQRWGIEPSSLPEGSEIRFRDPTVWDQYHVQILAMCAAFLVQAGLISWLIYEHRRRHLAEVLARHSMSELSHMNRVATAGELSASIAHEVSQPLTGILTRTSAARRWLGRETPDIDRARAELDQIEAAGHRASDIIENVRSFFKKDTQDKSQVDINKLVWTVVGLVYIDLRKHQIDLQSELDDQLPPVLGNQVQLQQVILNLIMNAIDSMRSVEPRVLSVQSRLNGAGMVQVSIKDTGIGIAPPDRDRIFNPLFTTKENGMGMGLSICRSIIENHDGRIWVSPDVDGGSIFQFELPTRSGKGDVGTMAAGSQANTSQHAMPASRAAARAG